MIVGQRCEVIIQSAILTRFRGSTVSAARSAGTLRVSQTSSRAALEDLGGDIERARFEFPVADGAPILRNNNQLWRRKEKLAACVRLLRLDANQSLHPNSKTNENLTYPDRRKSCPYRWREGRFRPQGGADSINSSPACSGVAVFTIQRTELLSRLTAVYPKTHRSPKWGELRWR